MNAPPAVVSPTVARAVARLVERGRSEMLAQGMILGALRDCAGGEGDFTPETRRAAGAVLAGWDSLPEGFDGQALSADDAASVRSVAEHDVALAEATLVALLERGSTDAQAKRELIREIRAGRALAEAIKLPLRRTGGQFHGMHGFQRATRQPHGMLPGPGAVTCPKCGAKHSPDIACPNHAVQTDTQDAAQSFDASTGQWLSEAGFGGGGWTETLHPRGQPQNRGEFSSKGGGGGFGSYQSQSAPQPTQAWTQPLSKSQVAAMEKAQAKAAKGSRSRKGRRTRKPKGPKLPPGVYARAGVTGKQTQGVQKVLDYLGYDLGSEGTGGSFGPATVAAVRKFQGVHGMAQTGVVDTRTLHLLNAAKNMTRTRGKRQGFIFADEPIHAAREEDPVAGHELREASYQKYAQQTYGGINGLLPPGADDDDDDGPGVGSQPPNLRETGGDAPQMCRTCVHWDGKFTCLKYRWPVDADDVCDDFRDVFDAGQGAEEPGEEPEMEGQLGEAIAAVNEAAAAKDEAAWVRATAREALLRLRLGEATFTQDQRDKLADKGHALPDGSFPIRNVDDLHNAMQAVGRADPAKRAAVRAHIRKRAKALNAESHLSDSYKSGD